MWRTSIRRFIQLLRQFVIQAIIIINQMCQKDTALSPPSTLRKRVPKIIINPMKALLLFQLFSCAFASTAFLSSINGDQVQNQETFFHPQQTSMKPDWREDPYATFAKSRSLQGDDKCNSTNYFPVFYGGIQHNFVRSLHVSPDEKYIVMCGESYSPQNFVDRAIEAYIMMVHAESGQYIWGKYYQDKATNASTYLGLTYSCKFVSDQKILVSGQANFYKAFIGIINVTDGTFTDTVLFDSNDPKYKVGYATHAINMASDGSIYAGIYYLGSALSIVKFKPGETARSGTKARPSNIWISTVGKDETAGSQPGPALCLDNEQTNLYVGTSIQYNNGFETDSVSAMIQINADSGNFNFFKRDLSIDGVNQMNCLPDRQGVIGCGNRAATSYIFRIKQNGDMLFNYVFTGDNPESCQGLVVQSQALYVLLETQSSTYTKSGNLDSVILMLDINGRPRTGAVFTVQSKQQLARGLFMMSDGSLIFAGATRKVYYHNYQYYAFYLQRMNILSGDKTCLTLESVPDPKAISYKDDQSQYGEAQDSILNSNLTRQANDYIMFGTISPDQLLAWDLKTPVPYKQYQTCFIEQYENPFEKVVENRTEVNIIQPSTDQLLNGGILIYYLGEVNQYKKLENWLYQAIKDQGLSISLSNGKALPSFITVKNDSVYVNTNSPQYIGKYAVRFTGCYNSKQAQFFQGIEIKMNTPPILNFSRSATNFTFTVGGSWQVSIPQIQDKELNSEFLLTISTSPTNRKTTRLPYFMKYDPMTQIINVNPQSLIDVGFYVLYLRVQEVDAPSYLNDYIMNVTIVPPAGSIMPRNNSNLTGTKLKGKLDKSEIKQAKIIIKFNMDIEIPPQSPDTIKDQGFITLNVNGPQEPYDYTWTIEQIQPGYIKFAVLFREPNRIGIYDQNEIVNITFNPLIIRSKSDQSLYLSNLEYLQEIQLILNEDDQQIQTLNQAAVVMKTFIATVMGASVASSAAMTQVMQNLWAIINTLQLLTYMAFMTVNLTPQLYIVFNMLLASHFDVLPIKDWITSFLIDQEDSDGIVDDPFTSNMGLFGYETRLVYVNLIDGFFVFCLMAISYISLRLLFIIIPHRFPKIKEFIHERIDEYKWNAVIRAFIELYLDITLFSFIGFVRFKFEDLSRGSSTSLSLVAYPLSVAVVPYTFFFIKRKMVELKSFTAEESKRVDSVVEGVNVLRPWARNFLVLFLARRVYYCFLFTFPPEQFVIQLSLNVLHCVAQIAYMIIVRPYKLKLTNFQETVNECCLLTVAILLFQLTSLNEDYDSRMKVSWAIIFVIFGDIIFNFLLLLYETLMSIKKCIAEYLQKRKAAKYEMNTDLSEIQEGKVVDRPSHLNLKKFHDASIKDFIMPPEEIKEGEPVQGYPSYLMGGKPQHKMMQHYLPDDSVYEGKEVQYRTHDAKGGYDLDDIANTDSKLQDTSMHYMTHDKEKPSRYKRPVHKVGKGILSQRKTFNEGQTYGEQSPDDYKARMPQDDNSRNIQLTTTPSQLMTNSNLDESNLQNDSVPMGIPDPEFNSLALKVSSRVPNQQQQPQQPQRQGTQHSTNSNQQPQSRYGGSNRNMLEQQPPAQQHYRTAQVTQSVEQLIQDELKKDGDLEQVRKSGNSSGSGGSGGANEESKMNVNRTQTMAIEESAAAKRTTSLKDAKAEIQSQKSLPQEQKQDPPSQSIQDSEKKKNYQERTKKLRALIGKQK